MLCGYPPFNGDLLTSKNWKAFLNNNRYSSKEALNDKWIKNSP